MPAEEGDPRSTTLSEKLAELRSSFRPAARRGSGSALGQLASSDSLGSAASGVGGGEGEGAAVKVLVRCRPQVEGAAPVFSIAPEPCGRERTLLRLAVPDEAEGGAEDAASRLVAGRARAREPRCFRCNGYLGPGAAQEEVFREAASIVENVMQGYNGTVFCYGVTGSGKTYTMSGPPEGIGRQREAAELGIAQRVSTRIFEYIRDRSTRGEVFLVEASFLEIYSNDGSREQLIDLLAQDERKIEVRQDPLNPQSFICDGLCKVPISSPDELCEVLNAGQQRCTFMETTKNCLSSRSHCLFMLSVESLDEQNGSGRPVVQRGKLMLVDLAGSESLKKVHAANDAKEDLRRKQAIGINRVLTSLGTVVNNLNMGRAQGHRDSALTMLLHDCLGGNARALLVANIGPDLAGMEESVKTLTFAQQMMSVRNVASVNRIEGEHSALLQMRQRHSECIRILQDKISDSQEEEQEAQQKLRLEMESLNKKLLTKESAEKTLEEMRDEQLRKIDEMKAEMADAMSKELEKMRVQSLQDLEQLRKSMEQHVSHMDGTQQQQHAEEHEARLGSMRAELQLAAQAQRGAEDEASELRVRLASAEERAKMLSARQEELRREREAIEEERRQLRERGEQQWQSLITVETELQRCKAEGEVQRAELARLNAARAEDDEALRREREAWRKREAELVREIAGMKSEAEESRRETQLQALRSDSEQREAADRLRLQVERLESEAASRAEQLELSRQACARLEAEKIAALQREQALRQQAAIELQHAQDDVEEAKAREIELMHMLHEVQESIIIANSGQHTAASTRPGTPSQPPRGMGGSL